MSLNCLSCNTFPMVMEAAPTAPTSERTKPKKPIQSKRTPSPITDAMAFRPMDSSPPPKP